MQSFPVNVYVLLALKSPEEETVPAHVSKHWPQTHQNDSFDVKLRELCMKVCKRLWNAKACLSGARGIFWWMNPNLILWTILSLEIGLNCFHYPSRYLSSELSSLRGFEGFLAVCFLQKPSHLIILAFSLFLQNGSIDFSKTGMRRSEFWATGTRAANNIKGLSPVWQYFHIAQLHVFLHNFWYAAQFCLVLNVKVIELQNLSLNCLIMQ